MCFFQSWKFHTFPNVDKLVRKLISQKFSTGISRKILGYTEVSFEKCAVFSKVINNCAFPKSYK